MFLDKLMQEVSVCMCVCVCVCVVCVCVCVCRCVCRCVGVWVSLRERERESERERERERESLCGEPVHVPGQARAGGECPGGACGCVCMYVCVCECVCECVCCVCVCVCLSVSVPLSVSLSVSLSLSLYGSLSLSLCVCLCVCVCVCMRKFVCKSVGVLCMQALCKHSAQLTSRVIYIYILLNGSTLVWVVCCDRATGWPSMPRTQLASASRLSWSSVTSAPPTLTPCLVCEGMSA